MKNDKSVTAATGSPEREACVDVQLNRSKLKDNLTYTVRQGPLLPNSCRNSLHSYSLQEQNSS